MKSAYLATLAFAEAVAFWHGALDAAFTLRWVIMAIGAPLFFVLFGGDGDQWTASDAAVLVSLLILGLFGAATQWTPDQLTGYEELIHLTLAVGVFCVGLAAKDLRWAWRGLAAGISVSAIIAVAQVAGWQGITQAASPAGLFVNKNLLAEAGMVALIGIVANRDWRWTIGPLVAVILGHSIAVFGALGVAFAAWLVLRGKRFWGGLLLGIIAAGVIGCFVFPTPSAAIRIQFWHDAIVNMHWMGNGLGSFSTTFVYAEFAHNELIHYTYELGLWVIIPVAALFYLWLERSYEPEYLVLTSVVAVSVMSFPFHMPVTLFAASLAAGALARGRCRSRSRDGHSGVGDDLHFESRLPGRKGVSPRVRLSNSRIPDESARAATARRASQSARNEELATFRGVESGSS